jgi:phosphoglycerate dehydrogenase-like enzyme
MRSPRIRVASPSFSRHPTLRAELLARFPEAAFHDGRQPLAGDALVRFLADADGVVVGLERIDEALIARVPHLRIIAKYGVGLDNIALGACAARRVAVGWTPGVNAGAVAELTLTLMLGLATGAFTRAAELRAGVWNKVGGTLLGGRTVGIIGLGHVGRAVAALLEPFRCRILGNDIEDRRAWCEAAEVEAATKADIYATADVVTLHVPLTPETHHLIDAAALARFRTDAVLVNASRGPVVDLSALRDALVAGRLRGAALDVWEEEPAADAALLALPNVIGTPHIGGSAEEAVVAMGRAAIGHLVDHFEAAGAVEEERVPA